jgi:GNAT superfamily N-acetyltransferase
MSAARVEILRSNDVPEVVGVLCDAFRDYPVMRYVLGDAPDYEARLETLIGFFVRVRDVRDEILLGIRGSGGGLSATAMISYPSRGSPPEVSTLRERVWAELGEDARARYEAFGEATAPFVVDADHVHLNMIGTLAAARGTGLGRILLEAVHRISADDPTSNGVTLTTEVATNVPLYERFGYEMVGQASVGSAFTTWGFYRGDD